MDRLEQLKELNCRLLEDMPENRAQAAHFLSNAREQRRLLRSLMNVRPPLPLSEDFLSLQDEVLSAEREEKGVVDAATLPEVPGNPGLVLWQGDITRLKADAIVNAANSALLGCFIPCHRCIDNAIHSAAGLQLRDACNRLMQEQGHKEPTGSAKITPGYNLPSKYILHTVGPIIYGEPTKRDRELLASCYCSCLSLAAENDLTSVAFCCISTGEFHFPNDEAARIAVRTVKDFLKKQTSIKRVIFNVFQDADATIYRAVLRADRLA